MAVRRLGSRRGRTRAAAQLAVVALILALSTALGSAASASCAQEPTASPYAFVGTVTSLEDRDRIAHVTTEDGQKVIVVGSPETGNTVTSVDRTYVLGATYEFHPWDDTDPYSDNACSATRELSRPPTPQERRDAQAVPDHGADPTERSGALVIGTAGALAAAAAGIVALLVGRHRWSAR